MLYEVFTPVSQTGLYRKQLYSLATSAKLASDKVLRSVRLIWSQQSSWGTKSAMSWNKSDHRDRQTPAGQRTIKLSRQQVSVSR